MNNEEQNLILVLKQSFADQLEVADALFDIALKLSEASDHGRELTAEELLEEAEKIFKSAKKISDSVGSASSTLSRVVLRK